MSAEKITETASLRRGHVAAVTAAHCSAAFAALGLPPYLPQLLPELGDPQARWAGVLYVLPTLCTAVAAPMWGRLADRYGRRTLLVRAQLGLALAFTAAALAGSLPVLAAALAAQGLLGGTFAASAAYLASGLDGQALARGLALMQGSARAALAGAPVLAGLLATELSIRQMYGLAALLPLAAAVGTLLLPEPGERRAPKPLRSREIVDDVARAPRISVPGLCLAEAGFVLATVVTFPYFLPLAARIAPGLPPWASASLFALPHLCYLLAAAPALRYLRDRARGGLVAGYACAAVSALLHLVPVVLPAAGLGWLIAGRVLLGVALTAGLTALSQLSAEAARGRAPGRLFGTVEAWSKGGAVVAGVAASALAVWGAAAPLLVAVVTGLVLATNASRITAARVTPEIRSRP